jgi:hypothetical protein
MALKNKKRNQEIYELHKQGYSDEAIGVKYNLHPKSVYGIVAPYKKSRYQLKDEETNNLQRAKLPPRTETILVNGRFMTDIFYQVCGW